MKINSITKNGTIIASIESQEILIQDVQTALDLMMTAKYESDCIGIVISKENVTEEFFQLSSGIAGEVLQKFVNYQTKLAICGDYSQYTSKALADFIYECNKGNHIYFVSGIEEAIEKMI